MAKLPTQLEEPQVKWVKSWREIPDVDPNEAGDRLLRAIYFQDNNVIYAIKGGTTQYDLEHERYHAKRANEYVEREKQKHPTKTRRQIIDERYGKRRDKRKYGIEDDIAEEFEAHKYTYEKTKKPKHLHRQLSAMYAWLTETSKPKTKGVFYVVNKPSEVMKWLKRYLKGVNPPKEWLEDYKKLEQSYHKAFAENKDKPSSIYYGDKEYFGNQLKSKDLPNISRQKHNNQNWWDNSFYQAPTTNRRKRTQTINYPASLLPPQLGGEI